MDGNLGHIISTIIYVIFYCLNKVMISRKGRLMRWRKTSRSPMMITPKRGDYRLIMILEKGKVSLNFTFHGLILPNTCSQNRSFHDVDPMRTDIPAHHLDHQGYLHPLHLD